MLVKELIDRLNALDPDLCVIMPSELGDFAEVRGAYVDTARLDKPAIILVDERDPAGLMHVVRLVEAREA